MHRSNYDWCVDRPREYLIKHQVARHSNTAHILPLLRRNLTIIDGPCSWPLQFLRRENVDAFSIRADFHSQAPDGCARLIAARIVVDEVD